jgi:hypothetical protein
VFSISWYTQSASLQRDAIQSTRHFEQFLHFSSTIFKKKHRRRNNATTKQQQQQQAAASAAVTTCTHCAICRFILSTFGDGMLILFPFVRMKKMTRNERTSKVCNVSHL